MPRRVTKRKASIFTPAGTFIRRVSDDSARVRRRIFFIGFAIIGVFFAYSFVSGDYGVPRIVRLELERKGLETANRRQLAMLIDASRERDQLKTDSTYIEYIARTKYHMAHPNETIYRYRGR
ncbi:MAG: septum formation initiator family protein [Candidatus Zixiibacteriota bacterium]